MKKQVYAYSEVINIDEDYISKINEISEYALDNNLEIIKVFQDETNGRRDIIIERLDQILNEMIDSGIDELLIFDFSIISRNIDVVLSVINLYRENEKCITPVFRNRKNLLN
ncbi:hypothetical protein D3C73_509990 [compost metagenome]